MLEYPLDEAKALLVRLAPFAVAGRAYTCLSHCLWTSYDLTKYSQELLLFTSAADHNFK